MNIKRHGDLIFTPTQKIEGKLIGQKSFGLSEGETTGHIHLIKSKTKTDDVKVYEGKNGEMIIEVFGKAVLTHPEHKTLEFTTGTYKMHKEQEYDYWQLATRKVID
jgi:hypothetical protein